MANQTRTQTNAHPRHSPTTRNAPDTYPGTHTPTLCADRPTYPTVEPSKAGKRRPHTLQRARGSFAFPVPWQYKGTDKWRYGTGRGKAPSVAHPCSWTNTRPKRASNRTPTVRLILKTVMETAVHKCTRQFPHLFHWRTDAGRTSIHMSTKLLSTTSTIRMWQNAVLKRKRQ